MAVKIVDTGVTIVNDDSDNSDVNYSIRENLNNMNPIPDNNTSRKRYIPLVGTLFSKQKIMKPCNQILDVMLLVIM